LVDDPLVVVFAPLVCFYRSGDEYDFGTFYMESSTNRLKLEVEVVEYEGSDIYSHTVGMSIEICNMNIWIYNRF